VTTAPATRELPVTTSSGAVPTVGVEEQFMLLWPDGEAACIAPELLGRLPGEIRARAEFARYRVESATGGCAELAAVGRNLSIARRVLAEGAADLGARLLAVGTPPFGVPGAEVTCACHVTVGLPDPGLGVAVLERLQPWLPALLALTGNSPLWRGHDTGWSSYRFVVQRRWPTFVPPPWCTGAADYDAQVAGLVAGAAALDDRGVYFLARLSEHYPTVEIRVPDTCPTVGDAVLMAGVCRALVAVDVADEESGRPVLDVPDRVLAAVTCAAARRGLSALVVAPDRGHLAPAREVVDQLMTRIAPALQASGDDGLLGDLLGERLRRGSGAERQRALWRLGRRDRFVQALANLSAGLDTGFYAEVPRGAQITRRPAVPWPATPSG
jgi:glutamate---cysteine ligase / carboxylate-amine ligase